MVHLITSMPTVEESKLPWLFTDGHPLVVPSKFFNLTADLDRVDWPLMKAEWWNNTDEDLGRTRRRQAEFLIHRFVPWSLIQGIGTKTEDVATKVRELLNEAEKPVPVKCKPEWYF